MTNKNQADEIRGKTVRWTFDDGPMKGKTFEHKFNEDGTVVFRAVEPSGENTPTKKKSDKQKGDSKSSEQIEYAAMKVSDHVYAVSYLGGQGYTLTVVLNLDDGRLVGFASNEKEWYPLRGTFEMVEKSKAGKSR
jgi:molybdenum cofactor biosynthesis protein MoaF